MTPAELYALSFRLTLENAFQEPPVCFPEVVEACDECVRDSNEPSDDPTNFYPIERGGAYETMFDAREECLRLLEEAKTILLEGLEEKARLYQRRFIPDDPTDPRWIERPDDESDDGDAIADIDAGVDDVLDGGDDDV